MKNKFPLFLIIIILSFDAFSQEAKDTILLYDGTCIVGKLKDFDITEKKIKIEQDTFINERSIYDDNLYPVLTSKIKKVKLINIKETTNKDLSFFLNAQDMNSPEYLRMLVIQNNNSMENFRKQMMLGIWEDIIGAGVTSAGIAVYLTSDSKAEVIISGVLMGAGSALSLIGLITSIDSFKYLRKQKLSINGNGIIFKL